MKLKKRKKSISAQRLIDIIKTVTGEDPNESTRKREVVTARHIFFKVFRDIEKWSYSQIGAMFDLDHATVRHGKMKLEDIMSYDDEVSAMYHRVLAIFEGSQIVDTDIIQEEVYGKILETNDLIKQQNAYIAEMKSEMSKMKQDIKMVSERNMAYAPIIDTLLNRLPKSKIDKAHSKIKAVLNGI